MEIFKACSLKRCQFLFWIKKTLLICFSQWVPKINQKWAKLINASPTKVFLHFLSQSCQYLIIFNIRKHLLCCPTGPSLEGGQGGRSPLYFFRIYYKRVLNLEIFKKTLLVAAPQVSKCYRGHCCPILLWNIQITDTLAEFFRRALAQAWH